MTITLLDRVLLLVTGLIALYLVVFFLGRRRETGGQAYTFYYAAAFAVVLVAGLLLIALGYGVLGNPLVVIVAALIPLCLALGLVGQLYPKYEMGYLIFAVAGLLGIAVTRFTGSAGLATAVLAIIHSVAGLTIFFLPLIASAKGRLPGAFAFVTLGGTLIGIGGIALAFLKAGRPILPADFIFAILAPLLLLMTLAFAIGFVRGSRPVAGPAGAGPDAKAA